jgi:hypothetical protein
MRRRLVLPALVAVAAIAVAIPAEAAQKVRVATYRYGKPTEIKPAGLSLSNGQVVKLKWTSWGRATTKATGKYSTAGFGGEHKAGYNGSVRVTLSGRRSCKGKLAYTRMTLSFTKKVAGKKTRTFTRWGSC